MKPLIPGFRSVSAFANSVGLAPSVVFYHLKNGYCTYPRQEQNNLIKHPLYSTWASMIQRCTNSSVYHYKYYGAKGIKICPQWFNSTNFISDVEFLIGSRPSKKYSLDRIDVNGNYEPGNIRWASRQEQAENKRIIKLGVTRAGQGWRVRKTILGETFDKFFSLETDAIKFAQLLQEESKNAKLRKGT